MDTDKILDELNKINIELAEIKQTIKYRQDFYKIQCERIDRLDKLLNGNGSPGIRTQVFILWGAFLFLGGIIGEYLIK